MSLKAKKIVMSLCGVLLLGICIALLRKANLGTDPFTIFVEGITAITQIPYFVVYILVNAVLLLFVLFLKKKYIGIATVLNLFLVGIITDFCLSFFDQWFRADTPFLEYLTLFVGLTVLCFASSLYITADLGVSTYDAIALMMRDKKILPFRFARILTDLICVGAGFLLGAVPGVGTIITAFFMGPIISFLNTHFSEKLLYGNRDKVRPLSEEKK